MSGRSSYAQREQWRVFMDKISMFVVICIGDDICYYDTALKNLATSLRLFHANCDLLSQICEANKNSNNSLTLLNLLFVATLYCLANKSMLVSPQLLRGLKIIRAPRVWIFLVDSQSLDHRITLQTLWRSSHLCDLFQLGAGGIC